MIEIEVNGMWREVYDLQDCIEIIANEFSYDLADKMNDYINDQIKEYEKEGKMHLIIGIGCTGGQHRSVSLTNYFADHYSKVYQVHRLHRDADH